MYSPPSSSDPNAIFAPRATRARTLQRLAFWMFRLATYFILAAASYLFGTIIHEGGITVFKSEAPFVNWSFLTDRPQTLYVFHWDADAFTEERAAAVEEVEAAIRREIPEKETHYQEAIQRAERDQSRIRAELRLATDELKTLEDALDAVAQRTGATTAEIRKLERELRELRRETPGHPQLGGVLEAIRRRLSRRDELGREKLRIEKEISEVNNRRNALMASLPARLRREAEKTLDDLQASLEWPEPDFFAERDAERAEVVATYDPLITRTTERYERKLARVEDPARKRALEQRMDTKLERLEEEKRAKLAKASSFEVGDRAYRGIYARKVEAAGVDVKSYSYSGGGIFPAIAGTVLLTLGSMVIALTLGILSAIFLSEYAKPGTFLNLIRLSILNLAGVPSIVFGLFGFGMFVIFFDWNVSLLAGCFTLAFMVLPVIITSSEEALRAVPQGFREGSLALGATKWTSIRTNVLPYALPGILTSSVLGVARVAGETAPIMFTAAYALRDNLPWEGLDHPLDFFFQGVMALPYHIYVVSSKIPQNEYTERMQYGTAFVFLLIVSGIALTSILLRVRMRKRYKW